MANIIGSGLEAYLHRQARERALNRIAEAKEEAQQVVEQANVDIEAVRREIDEQTQHMIDDRRRRALAQARLRAKQATVRRHEELIERVWTEAAAVLEGHLEATQRMEILKRCIADAADQLGGGPLEISVNAEDRQLLTSDVLAEMADDLKRTYGVSSVRLSDSDAMIWGGAIVRRSDAPQLVDNSLNERWKLARRALRGVVYRLLTTEDLEKTQSHLGSGAAEE